MADKREDPRPVSRSDLHRLAAAARPAVSAGLAGAKPRSPARRPVGAYRGGNQTPAPVAPNPWTTS